MSILLDALKQAEQEKKAHADNPPTQSSAKAPAATAETLTLSITAEPPATEKTDTEAPVALPEQNDPAALTLNLIEPETQPKAAPASTPSEAPPASHSGHAQQHAPSSETDAAAHTDQTPPQATPEEPAALSLLESPEPASPSDSDSDSPSEQTPDDKTHSVAASPTDTASADKTAALLNDAATPEQATHTPKRSPYITSLSLISVSVLMSAGLLLYSYLYSLHIQESLPPAPQIPALPETDVKTIVTQPPVNQALPSTSTQAPATTPPAQQAATPPSPSSPEAVPRKQPAHTPKTATAPPPDKTMRIQAQPSVKEQALALIHAGKLAAAEQLIETRYPPSQIPVALQPLYTWILIQQDKWIKAQHAAEIFYKQHPDNLKLARLLANIYQQRNNPQLHLLAQRFALDPVIGFYAAQNLIQRQQPQNAAALLERLLNHTPTAELLYLRAYLHYQEGEYEAAARLLTQSTRYLNTDSLITFQAINTLYQNVLEQR